HAHAVAEAAAADEVNLVVVVDDVLDEAAGELLILRRIRIDGPAQFLGHEAEAHPLCIDHAEAHGPAEAVADFDVDGAGGHGGDLRALAVDEPLLDALAQLVFADDDRAPGVFGGGAAQCADVLLGKRLLVGLVEHGGGLGHAAASAGEIGLEDSLVAVAACGQNDAGGFFDRFAAARGFGIEAAVGLAAHVGVKVKRAVYARGVFFVEGIGAGGDGLGFVGFILPVGIELLGKDALEVIIEIDIVDHVELVSIEWDEAIFAAIVVVIDSQAAFDRWARNQLALPKIEIP